MKRLLLAVIFLMLSGQLFSKEKKREVELTYAHAFTWKNLMNFKAGKPMRFMQFCTTESDSIVYGTINFPKSSIADVKKCSMSVRIINDTIYNHVVETKKKKHTQALLQQVTNEYDTPTEMQSANGKVMIWREPHSDNQVITTLTIDEKGKKGFFISKVE